MEDAFVLWKSLHTEGVVLVGNRLGTQVIELDLKDAKLLGFTFGSMLGSEEIIALGK